MQEIALAVPTGYLDIWRVASLDCMKFWLEAVEKDREEVREALNREDQRLASNRLSDMGHHQRALVSASNLVSQFPPPAWDKDADRDAPKFFASPSVLAEVAQEAVRFCVRDMGREAAPDPVDVEPLREQAEQLAFWLDTYERVEAARLEEVRKARANDEREAA